MFPPGRRHAGVPSSSKQERSSFAGDDEGGTERNVVANISSTTGRIFPGGRIGFGQLYFIAASRRHPDEHSGEILTASRELSSTRSGGVFPVPPKTPPFLTGEADVVPSCASANRCTTRMARHRYGSILTQLVVAACLGSQRDDRPLLTAVGGQRDDFTVASSSSDRAPRRSSGEASY